ncbi:MAG TPA: hypothetical protein VJB06_03970 [archaeon]|nr:hypothetical protein [archaeon]
MAEENKVSPQPKKPLLAHVKGDKTRTDYDVAYEHDRTVKKKFKLKIVYNKNGCIASGHCVLSDPYNFVLDEQFKADLKDSKELPGPVKGTFVKEIETDSPHLILNAAKTCTPKVIAIIDMETGKRIAP